MNLGKLDTKIKIYNIAFQSGYTSDSEIEVKTLYKEVYCAKNEFMARRLNEKDAQISTKVVQVLVHYDPIINLKQEVELDNENFAIKGIMEKKRKSKLILELEVKYA